MLAYVVRRLVIGVAVILLATVLVFLLVVYSGNPLALLRANPKIPKATILAREQLLHLNDPLWRRYWIWISNTVRGNFGTSIFGQSVGTQLNTHFVVTLRLVLVATFFSIFMAIGVGVYTALRKGRLGDHIGTTANFLFLAMPTFVLGILLKNFVAIPINQGTGKTIFYTLGEQSPLLTGSFFSRVPDYAAHMLLPVITLALVTYSSWAIYQRAAMLEVLDSDYVRLARAKGLSRRRVLIRHVLRNALIPITTVVALDFAAVLGGAIITETIYSWNGMGVWFYTAVTNHDLNIVLAYLVVTATFVILFNILADIAYAWLDPRIRYA